MNELTLSTKNKTQFPYFAINFSQNAGVLPYRIESCGVTNENVRRMTGTNDYMLSYSPTGEFDYYLEGKTIRICAPFMVITHPREAQYIKSRRGNQKHHKPLRYWLHFEGNDVPKLLKQLGMFDDRIFLFKNNDNKIMALIEEIYTEVLRQNSHFETFSASHLLEILSITARYSHKKNNNNIEQLSSVVEYIQRNIDSWPDIDHLASLAAMSHRTFIREFKKKFDMTPHQYVVNAKIMFAKDLLKKTNMSIKDISVVLGYVAPTHFSNTFKKYEQCSPKQYRDKHF